MPSNLGLQVADGPIRAEYAMAHDPTHSSTESPETSRVAEWLTPARGWWLGVALLAFALIYSALLLPAIWTIGGPELGVSLSVSILDTLVGIAVPLGASFLVASLVAATIRRFTFSGPAIADPASVNDSRLPPRLSPRRAVLLGVGMIAVGLLDRWLTFAQFVPQQPSIERDIASFLVPFVSLLLPIGVPLIAAGWLLGLLHNRAARPLASTTEADAP
jgi:hypothetical protein